MKCYTAKSCDNQSPSSCLPASCQPLSQGIAFLNEACVSAACRKNAYHFERVYHFESAYHFDRLWGGNLKEFSERVYEIFSETWTVQFRSRFFVETTVQWWMSVMLWSFKMVWVVKRRMRRDWKSSMFNPKYWQ